MVTQTVARGSHFRKALRILLQEVPMGKFLRVAALLCCLGVLVLGTIALDPNGPLLSSFRGCAGEGTTLGEAIGRQEHLNQTHKALRRHREAKWHIAEEVMAGRLSLVDAMERFHALDLEWPPSRVRGREHVGMSEDEWDGRHVLFYVLLVLQSRHDEGNPVLDHLTKELQEILADRKKRLAAPVEKSIERSH
jgi:hypothetical protein